MFIAWTLIVGHGLTPVSIVFDLSDFNPLRPLWPWPLVVLFDWTVVCVAAGTVHLHDNSHSLTIIYNRQKIKWSRSRNLIFFRSRDHPNIFHFLGGKGTDTEYHHSVVQNAHTNQCSQCSSVHVYFGGAQCSVVLIRWCTWRFFHGRYQLPPRCIWCTMWCQSRWTSTAEYKYIQLLIFSGKIL